MSSAGSRVQNNLAVLRNRLARLQRGEGPANRTALNAEIARVQQQINNMEAGRRYQARTRTPPRQKRARSRSSSRNASPSRSPPNYMQELQRRVNRLRTSLNRHFNVQFFPHRFNANNHYHDSVMFPTPYSVVRAQQSLARLEEEMANIRRQRRVRRRTSRAGSDGSVSSHSRTTHTRSRSSNSSR